MAQKCRLDALAGRDVPCSGRCPFWDPGGAVLDGRCMFELIDLSGRPAVVAELRAVRDELRAVGSGDEAAAIRHRFHRLINESGEL